MWNANACANTIARKWNIFHFLRWRLRLRLLWYSSHVYFLPFAFTSHVWTRLKIGYCHLPVDVAWRHGGHIGGSLHDRRFMRQAGRTRYFARSATRARSARRGEEKNWPWWYSKPIPLDEPFSYVKTFFCCSKSVLLITTWVKFENPPWSIFSKIEERKMSKERQES